MLLFRVLEKLWALTFTCLAVATTTQPLNSRLRHFINLTNGIEVVPTLIANGVKEAEINYVRIQSTHCESRNYISILENIDTNLLMNLARGNICLLYDYGSRGTGKLIGEDDEKFGIPRAYWLGVEWIRHALADIWNLPESCVERRYVRGYNSVSHFNEQVQLIPKTLRRKLKYYRPYLVTEHLHLYPIYKRTIHDSNKQFHVDLLTETMGIAPTQGVSEIDHFIMEEFIPQYVPDMALYRPQDFLGKGRASAGSM